MTIYTIIHLATRTPVAESLTFDGAAETARSLNATPAGYRGLYGVEVVTRGAL